MREKSKQKKRVHKAKHGIIKLIMKEKTVEN